jgi:hypothetical protein
LESWQPQTTKSENSKRDVGQSYAANEKGESWQLFDHKLSDPNSLIIKKLPRLRATTAANVLQLPESFLSSNDSEPSDTKVSDKLADALVLTSKVKIADGPALNLRCLPLLLRAMYTFQDKHVLTQNIILKGSGYRILIKAARCIKEKLEIACTSADKKYAQKYRNETLPALLRLLPHVLHQVQDENWSSFSMGLEFAWWLSDIAPVQLSISGLHVLSCACVLGCRYAHCYYDFAVEL